MSDLMNDDEIQWRLLRSMRNGYPEVHGDCVLIALAHSIAGRTITITALRRVLNDLSHRGLAKVAMFNKGLTHNDIFVANADVTSEGLRHLAMLESEYVLRGQWRPRFKPALRKFPKASVGVVLIALTTELIRRFVDSL